MVSFLYKHLVLKHRCKKLNIIANGEVKVGRGVRNICHATIIMGRGSRIDRNVTFSDKGTIIIGENTNIAEGTWIYAGKAGGVTIGNNCLIARGVFIIDSDHGLKKGTIIDEQPNVYTPISIGNDCLLGHRCIILRGTALGDGCVVGAGAVVKGTFADNVVLGGVPAKAIKNRE